MAGKTACCLTHWGRVTHVCLSTLTIIGPYNGLLPDQCQTIIWTNAGILLIKTLGTSFSEILSKIQIFHWRKCIWKCRLQNHAHFVSAFMCQGCAKETMEQSTPRPIHCCDWRKLLSQVSWDLPHYQLFRLQDKNPSFLKTNVFL